jgi:hypothetical protein
MTMNEEFANCELSIEELDGVAGGGWFSRALHAVEHAAVDVWHVVESPGGAAVLGIVGAVTGIFGSPLQWGQTRSQN